jgi:hypothetical protein
MALCKVEIFHCALPGEKEKIETLAEKAKEQLRRNTSEFEKLFPWDFTRCQFEPDVIHVIASTDDIICGWAVLQENKIAGKNILDLDTITTRRKRMGEQRIGRMMFEKIREYYQTKDLDFIMLHGINDAVLKIYTSWGFAPMFSAEEIASAPETPQMLRAFLKHLMIYPSSTEVSKSFKDTMLEQGIEIIKKGYLMVEYGPNNTKGGKRKTQKRGRQNKI